MTFVFQVLDISNVQDRFAPSDPQVVLTCNRICSSMQIKCIVLETGCTEHIGQMFTGNSDAASKDKSYRRQKSAILKDRHMYILYAISLPALPLYNLSAFMKIKILPYLFEYNILFSYRNVVIYGYSLIHSTRLAREGSAMYPIGPEPILGLPYSMGVSVMKELLTKGFKNSWHVTPGMRQAKAHIEGLHLS
ncbi:hypothetical protein NQ317_005161 [Molorchus minor]|uniref:Uncharacterized protein n=1 Tax=Molorchus minor TaxID=1323400 RepID=A0ABQ9JZH7_9CUCU|nr:hypothetical protein NQ317_005161 [Molorchus minor]